MLSPAIAQAGTGGIITSFFDELFNHLDPYSRYIAPEANGEDKPDRPIWASCVGLSRHHAVVTTLDPAGPAAAAGLAVGDHILAIDGVPTRGQDAYTLNATLAGPPGSEVTLTILPHHGRTQTLSLLRVATDAVDRFRRPARAAPGRPDHRLRARHRGSVPADRDECPGHGAGATRARASICAAIAAGCSTRPWRSPTV